MEIATVRTRTSQLFKNRNSHGKNWNIAIVLKMKIATVRTGTSQLF
jgi:hypothetical protein